MSRLDEIQKRHALLLKFADKTVWGMQAALENTGALLSLFQPRSPAEPPAPLTPVLIRRKKEPTLVVAAFHPDGTWRTVEIGEEVPDIVAWYNVLVGLEQ